jgi:hypothetical protein
LDSKNTKWFIEPLNDLTNEILASELSREGLSSESETIIHFQDKPKRVYLIEYRFVTMLQKSTLHGRNIRVYRQRGNGQIEIWKFGVKKSIKQSKEFLRVKQLLK